MATRAQCRDRAVRDAGAVPASAQLQVSRVHGRVLDAQSQDRRRGYGHASGSLGQPHPGDGDRRGRVLRLDRRRPRRLRGAGRGGRNRGRDACAGRARLAARGAHPPVRTLGRRGRGGARRRRCDHGRTSANDRGRGPPRRRGADPKPAGPGGIGQPSRLDVRGQRPAPRARRGRRVAVRAGRHSGVRRLDWLFGMPPNPSGIASLHVLDGYIPPEFGFKSGGVVEVRTETGMRDAWAGTLDTGFADLGTRHVEGFAAGPIGGGAGLMLTGADEASSRFLDPVSLDNLHNDGRSSSLAAQLTFGQSSNLVSLLRPGRPRCLRRAERRGAGRGRPGSTAEDDAVPRRRHVAARPVRRGRCGRDRPTCARALRRSTPRRRTRRSRPNGRREDQRSGALFSVTHQRARHTIKAGGEAVGARSRRALLVRRHRSRRGRGRRPQRRGARPRRRQPLRLLRPSSSIHLVVLRAGRVRGLQQRDAQLRRALRSQPAARGRQPVEPARRRRVARAAGNDRARIVRCGCSSRRRPSTCCSHRRRKHARCRRSSTTRRSAAGRRCLPSASPRSTSRSSRTSCAAYAWTPPHGRGARETWTTRTSSSAPPSPSRTASRASTRTGSTWR